MVNQENIPNFISAGSPLGLRRKMLETSARLGAFVIFQDITYVATDKKWYAWYTPPMHVTESLDEMYKPGVK